MSARKIIQDANFETEAVVVPAPARRSLSPKGLRGDGQGEEGAAQRFVLEPSAEDVLRAARQVARRIVRDAEKKAERLRGEIETMLAEAASQVADAQTHASDLLVEAQDQVEQIEAAAREVGHADGYAAGLVQGMADGMAQAMDQIQEQLGRIRVLAESAAVTRRDLVNNAEADLVRLAIEIAEKIIRRELSADPSIVVDLVEAAIAEAGVTGAVRIRVNPADWDLISAYWAREHDNDAVLHEFVVDERITLGGVIIDTRAGRIDAQIETQLGEVRQMLTG